MRATFLGDQFGVAQALALHPSRDQRHLFDGVEVADVVPARELSHVALQVLHADVVVDAVDAALEHRPERLDAVRVGVPDDVLPRRCA